MKKTILLLLFCIGGTLSTMAQQFPNASFENLLFTPDCTTTNDMNAVPGWHKNINVSGHPLLEQSDCPKNYACTKKKEGNSIDLRYLSGLSVSSVSVVNPFYGMEEVPYIIELKTRLIGNISTNGKLGIQGANNQSNNAIDLSQNLIANIDGSNNTQMDFELKCGVNTLLLSSDIVNHKYLVFYAYHTSTGGTGAVIIDDVHSLGPLFTYDNDCFNVNITFNQTPALTDYLVDGIDGYGTFSSPDDVLTLPLNEYAVADQTFYYGTDYLILVLGGNNYAFSDFYFKGALYNVDCCAGFNLENEGLPGLGVIFFWDHYASVGGNPIAIEIIDNPSIACGCSDYADAATMLIPPNSNGEIWFDSDLADQCFVWRITTICPDGTPVSSEEICYQPSSNRLAASQDIPSTMEVFPNPTQDRINISLTTAYDSDLSAAVYDISGRKVHEISTVSAIQANTPLTVDWAAANYLNAGVYYIKFNTNKEVITRSFIVE